MITWIIFLQEKVLSETVHSKWHGYADEATISFSEYSSSYVYVTFSVAVPQFSPCCVS